MSLTGGLRGAHDLLNKLRRDADSLQDIIDSDRFFNFAVTAYSLIDWIRNDPRVPPSAKNDLGSMFQALKVCGDIANANKHFTLTQRKPVTQSVESKKGWGCGRYGQGAYGIGEETIIIKLSDGTELTALEFKNDIVGIWESFFVKHKIQA